MTEEAKYDALTIILKEDMMHSLHAAQLWVDSLPCSIAFNEACKACMR